MDQIRFVKLHLPEISIQNIVISVYYFNISHFLLLNPLTDISINHVSFEHMSL